MLLKTSSKERRHQGTNIPSRADELGCKDVAQSGHAPSVQAVKVKQAIDVLVALL